MTDFPDFLDNNDGLISDPSNPFYGLPQMDVDTFPDTSQSVHDRVTNILDVDNLSDVIIDFSDANVNELRGNRFGNIIDAIVYLQDAGILSFGDVTIDDDDEIGITIGYGEDE